MVDDPIIPLIRKARFCELVGNRLLPAVQSRVAHLTEPVELIDRLDELKKPPFYARTVVRAFPESTTCCMGVEATIGAPEGADSVTVTGTLIEPFLF